MELQVLAYPVTDCDFDTGSYRAFAEDHLLTRRDMQWFWDQYQPDLAQRLDPLASPLHTTDLNGSPAALILTADLDPLRDEGEDYGRRLQAAGIPVQVQRCQGMVHGFLAMVHYAPGAGRAFEDIVEAIDGCVRAAGTA